jgi:hypothetical protein
LEQAILQVNRPEAQPTELGRGDCKRLGLELRYFWIRPPQIAKDSRPRFSLKEHPMTYLRSTTCALLGLLALTGLARAQDSRDELPEGIRQLIRAADEAEQRVRRENGVAADRDAERQANRAARAAKTAIREYWIARFDYDRAWANADAARRTAAEAQSEFLVIKAAPIPDAARLQNAEMLRDKKLDVVADAEFKLEPARQALEAARHSANATTSTTTSRPVTPPDAPVPDNGSSDRAGADGSRSGWRLVYRNEQASYHLLGRMGTASYSRAGQPHLEVLDFVKETPHFFFYRPRSGDPTIAEWAFAKYAEIPAGDGVPMFAVWRHDREGWHWEWSHRDAPPTEMPAPPPPPVPGPIPASAVLSGQSSALLADQRGGAH